MALAPLVAQQLLNVLGVDAKDGVSPQGSGGANLAAGTRQGLGLEGMDGLVVAHLDGEVAVEVGLGDVELDTVYIGALVLAEAVDIQSTWTSKLLFTYLCYIPSHHVKKTVRQRFLICHFFQQFWYYATSSGWALAHLTKFLHHP